MASEVDPLINFSKAMVEAICDPVTGEPYVKPHLVDCGNGHTFSFSVVDRLLKEPDTPRCPLCRGQITTSTFNRTVHDVVYVILGLEKGQEHMDTMFKAVRQLKIDYDNGITYPFVKSRFTLFKSSSFHQAYSLVNLINTSTIKENHVFQRIWITYQLNFTTIYLECYARSDMQEAIDYFEKNNIIFRKQENPSIYEISFTGNNLSEILKTLTLIMMNNEFDEDAGTDLNKMINFIKMNTPIDCEL